MKSLTPFCSILLILFTRDANSQECLCAQGFCERGWVQYQNSCYKAVMEQMNWSEAETACQSYGWNSHLASIHSAEENDFIFHLMGKPLNHLEGKAYWIGGHDLFKEGTFVWTDGSAFDFKAFDSHQPDGQPGENYLGSWNLQTGFVTWNDYGLSWKFPSVCKYNLENRVSSSEKSSCSCSCN